MCGRFARFSIKPVIIEEFGIAEIDFEFRADYNIAPGSNIAAITGGGERRLAGYRWGLIPSWAKDASAGYKMFNARAETLHDKPSFKGALKKRRCLIVADGFYEWRKECKKKIPFFIRLKSRKPFGFAGLYEKWISPGGDEINSCTIITTQANGLLLPIHDRMPVIVRREEEALWLDADREDRESFDPVLLPYSAEEMEAFEVAPYVNSPANNSPECINPV